MPFFDSPEQKAEAQMNAGREKVKLAHKGRASALPSVLAMEDRVELLESAAKDIVEGQEKLRALKSNQSTDESQ